MMKKYFAFVLVIMLVIMTAIPASAASAFEKVEVVKDASYITYIDSGKGKESKKIGFTAGYGVGNSQEDDVVAFSDIDFGNNGAKEFTISFSYGGTDKTEFAVYIDNYETNKPICQFAVENTGGWKIENAKEFSSAVTVSGGKHNVYVKFINSSNSGSFSWIQFTEAPAAAAKPATVTTAAQTADIAVLPVLGMSVSVLGSAIVAIIGKRKHK